MTMVRSSPDMAEMARDALSFSSFDRYEPMPSSAERTAKETTTSVEEESWSKNDDSKQERDDDDDDDSNAFLEQLAMSRDIRQSIHHARDRVQVTQDNSMVMLERVQQLRERKRLLYEQARALQEKNKNYRPPNNTSRQRRNYVIAQQGHSSPGLINNKVRESRDAESPVTTQTSTSSCPPTPKDKVIWDSTSMPSRDTDSSHGAKTPTSFNVFPRSRPTSGSAKDEHELVMPVLSHSTPGTPQSEAKSDEHPRPRNSLKSTTLPPLKIDLPPLIITTKNKKKKKNANVVEKEDITASVAEKEAEVSPMLKSPAGDKYTHSPTKPVSFLSGSSPAPKSPAGGKYTHSPTKPVSSSSDETTATCSASKSAASLLDQTKNEQYYPVGMPSPIHVTIPSANDSSQQVSPLPDHYHHPSDVSTPSQQSSPAKQGHKDQNIHRRSFGPQHEKDTLQQRAAKQPNDQDFVSLVDQKIALADELADMREELASKKAELENLTRQCHRMHQEKKQLEELAAKEEKRCTDDPSVDAIQCSPERLIRRINGPPPEQGFSMLSLLNKYRSEKVI